MVILTAKNGERTLRYKKLVRLFCVIYLLFILNHNVLYLFISPFQPLWFFTRPSATLTFYGRSVQNDPLKRKSLVCSEFTTKHIRFFTSM